MNMRLLLAAMIAAVTVGGYAKEAPAGKKPAEPVEASAVS